MIFNLDLLKEYIINVRYNKYLDKYVDNICLNNNILKCYAEYLKLICNIYDVNLLIRPPVENCFNFSRYSSSTNTIYLIVSKYVFLLLKQNYNILNRGPNINNNIWKLFSVFSHELAHKVQSKFNNNQRNKKYFFNSLRHERIAEKLAYHICKIYFYKILKNYNIELNQYRFNAYTSYKDILFLYDHHFPNGKNNTFTIGYIYELREKYGKSKYV
jgi:hypothetical protein